MKLEAFDSLDSLQLIRPIWERFQQHPNTDFAFFSHVVTTRTGVVSPYVLLLSSDGRPKSMLVGRVEDRRVTSVFGYKAIFRPAARVLSIVYGGFMGDTSDAVARHFLEHLRQLLNRKEVDLVDFHKIPTDSPLYRAWLQDASRPSDRRVADLRIHRSAQLPSNLDLFLKRIKRKHRYWLRRTERILNDTFSDAVEVTIVTEPHQVPTLAEAAESVAALTYQRGLNAGFLKNAESVNRLLLEAKMGWLRAYLLQIRQKPVAFWIGCQYGDTFFLHFTGYDPRYAEYEVGTFLLLRAIEDLCRNQVSQLDFGFGDALYKQRFGDQSWAESDLPLHGSSLNARKIALQRNAVSLLSSLAKSLLDRFSLVARGKKAWRRRVRARPEQGA